MSMGQRTISVRVSDALYAAIARDAAKLELSMADVIRMLIRSGRVPSVTNYEPPADRGGGENPT